MVSTSIVKTVVPRLSRYVERARLFTLLDGLDAAPVVWISGPAGIGKTTLVASYLQRRGVQPVWYQLDARDADPAALRYYLGQSPDRAGSRSMPGRSVVRGQGGALERVFPAGEPGVLVLDDADQTAASSAFVGWLTEICSGLPEHARVYVLSRARPPAALARLRASGALVAVPSRELYFDPGEVRALAQERGVSLDDRQMQRLIGEADGWVAGLVLLLEEARFRGGEVPEVPEVVFDYIAGELFERFEPVSQADLLALSYLPRMTGEMACALSGDDQAEEILLNLVRNDFFLTRSAVPPQSVYQWHPLLRAFLSRRARESLPAGRQRTLQLRAAGILEEGGDVEDAAVLYEELGAWPQLAGLLDRSAPALLAQGRHATLLEWLERIPASAHGAAFTLWAAEACAVTSPREGRLQFETAHAMLTGPTQLARRRATCLGALRCVLAEGDDLSQLDPWIERLDETEGAEPADPAASALTLLALALREPGAARFRACWSRLEAVLPERGAVCDTAALALCLAGDQRSAARLLGRAEEGGAARWLARRLIGFADAREAADTGAGADGSARGDPPEGPSSAREILLELTGGSGGDALTPPSRLERAAGALWAAQLATESGAELLVSLSCLQEAAQLARECGAPVLAGLASAAQAPLLMEMQDVAAARRAVGSAAAVADRLSHPWLAAAVALARASADPDDTEALAAGLRQLRQSGLRAPPGWSTAALVPIVTRALTRDAEPLQARRLIEVHTLVPGAAARQSGGWAWSLSVRALGAFAIKGMLPGGRRLGLQGRNLELLQALVALGGDRVPLERLAEMLWPNVDGDYARKSLTITLHRLRRALPSQELIRLEDGRLSLDPERCWSDVAGLGRLLPELGGWYQLGAAPGHGAEAWLDTLFDLYRGALLAGEPAYQWVELPRATWRQRFVRAVTAASEAWSRGGDWERAAEVCRRGLDREPGEEALLRRLMRACEGAGEIGLALEAYASFRAVLASRGLEPSAELQAARAALESRLG